MDIQKWLAEAIQSLKKAGVATAKLDALVLLEDVLDKDRAHLLAHPDTRLTAAQKTKLDRLIDRRAKHEPLAYIRGKTEFYGRVFKLDKNVLEPRPESETMIEMLKDLNPNIVVDVGTGSGALAITAKLIFPSKEVIAIDIDPKCLKITEQNAKLHKVDLTIIKNDLLKNQALIEGMVILANLPYVPDDFHINESAGHEPKLAIFGGEDGLDIYRKMFKQVGQYAKKPRYILTESLPFQHKELAKIAQKHGYKQQKEQDFIQLFIYALKTAS